MAKLVLDAVAVSTTDMARAKAFYSVLGFDFEGEGAFLMEEHVEPVRGPGEPRLMIDSAQMMESLTGEPPRAPNHSVFAMLCEGASGVDDVAKAVEAAGFVVKVQPWDAPWGQRYATVCDPDGYMIDLFAPLTPAHS